MAPKPRFPGLRLTTNGNQLVSYHTEARITDAGVFYPITPSTEMGENYQLAFAEGALNVFGRAKIAIEAEGEHAAQGGAIAVSVTGKRVVNFTSGQGLIYGLEQYYHAPGKCSTLVVEIAARALTKHALNVHCGHDDIYAALDTGWTMLFAKDAQQAADQAVILRRTNELALNPGINIQDGFLTSHLERTFYRHESELLREYLGAPDDLIECPTEAQRLLFGPTRRRVPEMIDLKNPALLGPVQNQEHYMNGVVARRDNFSEHILPLLRESYQLWGELTGRHYGFVSSYRDEDAHTVFVSLGSAAENIEAAVDDLRDHGEAVGSVHVNVLRPFPEAAIIHVLRGKERVIVLERTDEPLAGENPLARDVRVAFAHAVENARGFAYDGVDPVPPDEVPRLFGGVYGLGSRDFRPEGILGAYEFARGWRPRRDGLFCGQGRSHFVVGVDHPYAVRSDRTPSLLPDHAIAVRLHSIGGWGMITTGKNLGEIIGELGEHVAQRTDLRDEWGRLKEIIHVSANPKYGSEKKGAPTAYFLVAAPERVRVNCDLQHVTVVLCCDPKAFTHMDPLEGLTEGGAFVWESSETPATAWRRIPRRCRQEILDRRIRVFLLPGFEIARAATDRPDLQMRMQGNAFLGAFFAVSPFLTEFRIEDQVFRDTVHQQYRKKFGRFGDAVVASNMEVMIAGYTRVREIVYGTLDDEDRSDMRLSPLAPCLPCTTSAAPAADAGRAPWQKLAAFDAEFRAGLGYHQPASPLASVGMMAAATGAGSSKFVARLQVPVFIAENCTQCMECIASCPDTALPNTAQELGTVLKTAALHYIEDQSQRAKLLDLLPALEPKVREAMRAAAKSKDGAPPGLDQLVRDAFQETNSISAATRERFCEVLGLQSWAWSKAHAIFGTPEKKEPGTGGLFGIFVSDLCKGCAECVEICGDKNALRMEPETEVRRQKHESATAFFDRLPPTPARYLGLYDDDHPQDSRAAALRNHLMVRRNYEALVSGDGACAGCGEKSVLRAIATLTEAYMRPLYHARAARLIAKAERLAKEGRARLAAADSAHTEGAAQFRTALAHLIFGLGGEHDADTRARLDAHGLPGDAALLEALIAVLRRDAFNHRELRAVDGRLANGMSVMAMGAHTGCNTVYGSTPPSNPHPYPWMNSLFQDGVTVAWLFGESFIMDHARRSVIPERLADALLDRDGPLMDAREYFLLTHFTDEHMTDREVRELPKAWAVGGDGGMGDIGYQNVSKVVLQNRPNVKILMLDTQVYSNTGGQNSDSAVMPGGFDMNQIGAATQGKLTEKKCVAETFTAGHGSPYVAQVSLANAAKLYKSVLDALEYRGTAFFQTFTTCQPEHGVGDDLSTRQASRVRDSRGIPEFVYDPRLGEFTSDNFDLKGNPASGRDWAEVKSAVTGAKYAYTVAHWAATEARFRRHLKAVEPDRAAALIPLTDFLVRITQRDVVDRRHLDPEHRAFVPDFGVAIATDHEGKERHFALSRQLVLFCVERRKAWRQLQSRAGVDNQDYRAQRALLARVDEGKIARAEFLANARALLDAERQALAAK